jgi:hypothetical protein
MANYAIHDGLIVHNVIVCESKEMSEELTGMKAIETDGVPWIGWTMEDEGWRPPKPGPEYTWNGSEWIADEPDPDDII